MDFNISGGNVLTIITIIGGFFLHYIAIYSKIIERIVRLEEKYESHKETTQDKLQTLKNDIDMYFERNRNEYKIEK